MGTVDTKSLMRLAVQTPARETDSRMSVADRRVIDVAGIWRVLATDRHTADRAIGGARAATGVAILANRESTGRLAA
jgi:hypothetical protein